MKNLFFISLVLGGVMFGFLNLASGEKDQGLEQAWIPGELVVVMKEGAKITELEEFARAQGFIVQESLPSIRTSVVRVPAAQQEQMERVFADHALVKRVSKNFLYKPANFIPDDPLFLEQWDHPKIGNIDAWDLVAGNTFPILAVIDSGVDTAHEDLAPHLLAGWDFYGNDSNYEDICAHGTETAGIAAAVGNNGLGIAGGAFSSDILPLKASIDSGQWKCYGSLSAISSALVFAADQGARIAVVNFGVYGGSSLNESLQYFVSKGGIVIAPGGNEAGAVNDPDNPYLVSVSATDIDDTLAAFSDIGPYIDLSAPGRNLRSTFPGNLYGAQSGTSAAAPVAAAAAALVMAADPLLSPAQVEAILEQSARDLGSAGYDIGFGWGRVDSGAAVRNALALSARDTVVVTKAVYQGSKKGTLVVEATSSQNGQAVLTVQGYGNMSYVVSENLYRLTVRNVPYPENGILTLGGIVSVISSFGGSDVSVVVKEAKGGGGKKKK
jgi:thermitase